MTQVGPDQPVGWRVFALVAKTFVLSCLLAWLTQVPEKHLRETVDAVVQSTLLASLDPLADDCKPAESDTTCVRMVSIGDDDYESAQLFGYTSPLNPDALKTFFDGLKTAADRGQAPLMAVVDLDLAPTSEADRERRAPLYQSIQALSRQIPVVLVCPQSFFHGRSTAMEQAFVDTMIASAGEGPGVRFAGAVIDSHGLYFDNDRPPLGAVAARWWLQLENSEVAQDMPPPNPCSKDHLVHDAGNPDHRMIVPSHVESVGFGRLVEARGVLGSPDAWSDLSGRIVVLGGTYGMDDLFRFRGVAEPMYGVMLHTWILQKELKAESPPSLTFRVMLDIVIGIFSGLLLSIAWKLAVLTRAQYGWHMLAYGLFMLLVVGMPLLLIYASVKSASWGITLGTAGMVISALFDALNTTKNLDDAPPSTPAGARPLGAGSGLASRCSALKPYARYLAGVFVTLLMAVMLLGVTRGSHFAAPWQYLTVFLVAMVLCSLTSFFFGASAPQSSTTRRLASGWRRATRASIACTSFQSSAYRRLDWCIYVPWVLLKVFAVVWLLTDDFQQDRQQWDLQPLFSLLVFGLGCLVYDLAMHGRARGRQRS